MSIFVKDPYGVICIFVTYVSVFYADYAITKWVIIYTMQNSAWGPFNIILFNVIVLFLTIAHLKAVCSDPGIVPLPQNKVDFSDMHSGSTDHDIDNNWTVCARCETYRPPRAHHCRVCKRCIRKMDHHCPWINNCVGEQNQKYFLQFLIYAGILSFYSVILVLTSWIKECPNCDKDVIVQQTRMFDCPALVAALDGLPSRMLRQRELFSRNLGEKNDLLDGKAKDNGSGGLPKAKLNNQHNTEKNHLRKSNSAEQLREVVLAWQTMSVPDDQQSDDPDNIERV